MSKITNKKQVEHGAANSKTHKADKAQNEARRSFTTIYIQVKTEEMFGFRREFSRYLGSGEQFAVQLNENYPSEGNRWKLIPKTTLDWCHEHEKMRMDRGWYWEERQRQRKAGKIKTVEKRPFHPFSDLFTTLAPWTQAYLFLLLKFTTSSGKRRVRRYLLHCLRDVIAVVAARTGNEVPFAYIHFDTDDLHVGVRPCCINALNQRIGEPWMRTVGHAGVGYDRQVRLNAGTQEGWKRLRRSEAIYRKRGEKEKLSPRTAQMPMDLELARRIDLIAEDHFGQSPYFIKAKECYYLCAAQKDISHYSKKTLQKKINELQERLATITTLEEQHAKAVADLRKASKLELEAEAEEEDEPDAKNPGGDEMPM